MPVLIALVIAAVVSATLFGAITTFRRSHDPGDVEEDKGAAKVGAVVAEHSRLKRFLLERRDPQKETGLLLTIAVAFIFAAILAIGTLLLMVRRQSGFARWDAAAARFGADNATSGATDVMKVITEFGTSRNVIAVAVVVGGIAVWRTRRVAIPAYLLTTVLSTMLVNNAVKWVVERPRPNLSRLVSHAGSSFPSGHTAAAAATYAAVALVLGRGQRRRVKAALATTAGVITVSVAASRVFLGVHWVTDVAAGAAMGWACFAVCSIAFGGRGLHFGRPVEVAQQVAEKVEEAGPSQAGRRHTRRNRSPTMTSVAVVAHNGKMLGDGLGRLREVLAEQGVTSPLWYEVPKSRKVPGRIREAIEKGADVIFVWGGDGSVQRAIDTVVPMKKKQRPTLAILPAGTANLLASNLAIPKDLEQAVQIGLHGADRVLDVGRMNGEHFAVMAGMGLDSLMIRDADGALKDRFGRAAYVWTGSRAVREKPTKTKVRVDGHTWFDGDASCVLFGNVGEILGGIKAFEHAKTDDGLIDVAVITAEGAIQWARTLARATFGTAEKSPLVNVTMAKKVTVTTAKALPYEMDGGVRTKTKELKVRVVPKAVTIRVPAEADHL